MGKPLTIAAKIRVWRNGIKKKQGNGASRHFSLTTGSALMQRTYKVSASTYFGLGLFAAGLAFVCLLVPCIFAYPPFPLAKVVLLLAVAVSIPAFTIWWLSRFRITITSSTLTYSSLYSGRKTVNLREIESSEVIIQRGLGGARPLLAVTSPDARLLINFKVFSKDARKDLFQTVGPDTAPASTRR